MDLFVPGVALKRFTPQQNPAAARISATYQWPGHSLKFERPEGEIDFLSVVLQTEPAYAWMDHGPRRIAVETPEEILVKKIRFRSARFTARDVFDLAATARARPGLTAVLAREVPDALERTLESLEHQARRGGDTLAGSVIPVAHAADLITEAFPVGRRVLREAIGLAGTP